MNRDSSLIFEAYQSHLQEMAVKLASDKAGAAGSTQVSFPPKSVGKYDLTPEQTKAVIEGVVTKLKDMNGHSDLSDKEFQVQVIAPIIKELAKKSGTNSGYAARVIYSALKQAGVLTSEEGEVTLDDATPEAKEQAADDVPEVAAEMTPSPEERVSEPAASGDKLTVRIEQMIANLIDDSGVNEAGVVKDVSQEILNSGGLGLKENEIGRKVKIVLNDLVKKQIFERKGQFVKLGKNFEKFEAGGSDSSTLSDEDVISQYTGHNTPAKTGRQAWGGEDGPMSSYFG